MKTVNLEEAKAHLSRPVDRAARGESFVIVESGKPMVKVEAFDAPAKRRRLGFLNGEIELPADFDRMGENGGSDGAKHVAPRALDSRTKH